MLAKAFLFSGSQLSSAFLEFCHLTLDSTYLYPDFCGKMLQLFFPVLGFNSTVIFFCAGWSSAASFYFILLRQGSGLVKIIYWLLVDVAKEATFKSTSSVLISFQFEIAVGSAQPTKSNVSMATRQLKFNDAVICFWQKVASRTEDKFNDAVICFWQKVV